MSHRVYIPLQLTIKKSQKISKNFNEPPGPSKIYKLNTICSDHFWEKCFSLKVIYAIPQYLILDIFMTKIQNSKKCLVKFFHYVDYDLKMAISWSSKISKFRTYNFLLFSVAPRTPQKLQCSRILIHFLVKNYPKIEFWRVC